MDQCRNGARFSGELLKIFSFFSLFLLALIYTLLNCLKPLHMDDVAYFTYAAQIMKNPFDPYGFEIAEGVPANHELLPPLLPYCLAPALSLFEDNPFLWKLSLLPFGLVLVFSLHVLFQRFAPSLEIPLTWFTVLSPAFLPSWNLMADVPVMALGFLSLHFFLKACDRSSVALAILAGMGAGLAM